MYTTCLFCHSALGANEVIEPFPVGRRLAFDAAKGRLWVVCRRCLRWNLTPLEERWEAIEQCERIFRDTKLRVSTDNIGMARVGEGLELIRIGQALRPEIAVWRYATVNARRRRRALITSGMTVAGSLAGMHFLGPLFAAGAGTGSFYVSKFVIDVAANFLKGHYRPIRLVNGSDLLVVSRGRVGEARIVTEDGSDWMLRVAHRRGTADLSGPAALRALAVIMAAVNGNGVKRRQVVSGEKLLDSAGNVEPILRMIAYREPERRRRHRPLTVRELFLGEMKGPDVVLDPRKALPRVAPDLRVALEMATNEETERRAMEGELATLEAAWKEAEEIAAIADDLLLSPDVSRRIDALRGAANRS